MVAPMVAFEEIGILWSRFCGSIAMVIETGKRCGRAMCGRDCVVVIAARGKSRVCSIGEQQRR